MFLKVEVCAKMSKENRLLDEQGQEAALHLLEKYWIVREEDPDLYYIIKDREKMLKNFFREKFGYQLTIHRFFVRLVKIPGEAEAWMGIQDFSSSQDYTFLCCLMAFLEEKGAQEQFLLSELVEAIQTMYPFDKSVDWTQYEERKSLVRLLKFVREMGLIVAVEGEETAFSYSEEGEVLYENTPQSRYFLRVFPRELSNYKNHQEILDGEWLGEEEHRGLQRRHRIYRKLFLSPGVMPNSIDDPDFLYLKNYRNTIQHDIEENFPASFELHKDLAMMIMNERRQIFSLFPDNKSITDIVLQFSGIIHEKLKQGELKIDLLGKIGVTKVDFIQLIQECQKQFSMGWTKKYREIGFNSLVDAVLNHLMDWKMAQLDRELDLIYLMPLLSRCTGSFPDDFEWEDVQDGE